MTNAVVDRTGTAAYGEVERLVALPHGGEGPHTPLMEVRNPGVRAALERFDDTSLDGFGFLAWSRQLRKFREGLGLEPSPHLASADLTSVDVGTGLITIYQAKSSQGQAAETGHSSIDSYRHVAAVNSAHRTFALDVTCVSWPLSASTSGAGGRSEPLSTRYVKSEEERPPIDVSGDAVRTVRALAQLFGVPVGDILKAAGISKSSFYSWDKPSNPRPRLSSQGALWALAELANDMSAEFAGQVASWLRADRTRRTSLRAGDLDALAAKAYEHPRQGDHGAPVYAITAGVHDELEGPLTQRPPQDEVLPIRRARVARRGVRRSHDTQLS